MRLVVDTFAVGLKVESVAFSRDERTIAAACTPFVGYGGSVVLWDAVDRRLVGKPLTVSRPSLVPTITMTDCIFQSVAFSPDGKTIAAGYTFNGPALSGVVLIGLAEYERLTNDPILVKEGGIMTVAKHNVQSVSFSPDGKIIVRGVVPPAWVTAEAVSFCGTPSHVEPHGRPRPAAVRRGQGHGRRRRL